VDAIDHGKAVLSAILPRNGDGGRRDLLDVALKRLTVEHFLDPQQRVIFQMLDQYLGAAGLVLPRSAVSDMLRGQPPGTALQYETFFDMLLASPPATEDFSWRVDQLRDLAAERQTGEALAQAMEILQRGAHTGKEFVQGHEAARAHAMTRFAEIEYGLRLMEAPAGDMRLEQDEILGDYAHRARSLRTGHGIISTSFPELDRAMGGGFQPSEFGLVVADTNVGKSSLCAHWAWHACTQQGKNVVVFTSETSRTQYRYKIIARHSRWLASCWASQPGWEWLADQYPQGLDTRLMRQGKLYGRGLEFLTATLGDFGSAPSYGRCWVAQVPLGATVGTIAAQFARLSRMFMADLVVVDYAALLRADRKRQSRREELADIAEAIKELARSAFDGRGVTIISPWQANREGSKAAKDRGYYTTSDLAETAGASSVSDAIFGLVEAGPDDSHGRRVPLNLGVVKLRDGERLRAPIELEADYATACYSLRSHTGPEAALADLGGLGEAPA
jgi:replicative DNA helicase